jgi:hypothetical protein
VREGERLIIPMPADPAMTEAQSIRQAPIERPSNWDVWLALLFVG